MRRTLVILTLGVTIVALTAGVALAATLKGTTGPDKIFGTAGGDYIAGLHGDDQLYGKAGKDKVIGGGGKDLVLGGDGADRLRGGNGVDRLRGGRGDDYISSVNDDSRDYVSCGSGNDTVEKIPGIGPSDSFADDCEKVKLVSLKLDVEKVSSGFWGFKRQQVVVAPSAAALSKAINQRVPDSGRGTYLAAFRGQEPSCGYSVTIESAERMRDQVTTSLVLKDPTPGMMVCSALTEPYAVAVVKDLDPEGLKFSFEDQRGQKLDWPVRRVSG